LQGLCFFKTSHFTFNLEAPHVVLTLTLTLILSPEKEAGHANEGGILLVSFLSNQKTRQDKTRQDKTSQDKTTQDKTTQDKTTHE
jgi:hypothetical protein